MKHLIGYGVTGIVALLIGIGIGGAGDSTSPASAGASGTTSTVNSTVTKTVSPKAAPATTVFKTVSVPLVPKVVIEEGVWEVGVDIKPGRYKVAEAISSDCYWEINRTGSSDIVDNGVPTGGRPVVTLKKGQSFTNQGCGGWAKVG